MFPVALSLGGMLMRVTVVAVVPRVVRILSRIRQAEAQVPAPVTADQPAEEPAPVVASPVRVQKMPTRRWTNTRSVKRKSPSLCAWWAPTGARAPPSHFGGSRSWAYLHTRSFPINRVDPLGLEEIYPDQGKYPSQELQDFRKEYGWPGATQEQMQSQINWENDALQSQITVHFIKRIPGVQILGAYGRGRAQPAEGLQPSDLGSMPSSSYTVKPAQVTTNRFNGNQFRDAIVGRLQQLYPASDGFTVVKEARFLEGARILDAGVKNANGEWVLGVEAKAGRAPRYSGTQLRNDITIESKFGFPVVVLFKR